ncbi:uncharacterized protein LOC141663847 [Apium graveolens]|uniref:uncharacterized protein LOC141663847 n=1 Tax=Apium graveolens TaxID=4045 RepID=UPI003D7A90CE
MEYKEKTPSVIARLMGLYESRPQRPIHKQYRVLSEDYLRKSASIDLLLKQSACTGRSLRMSRMKMPESKDVFERHEQQIQYIGISKEKETSWALKEGIRFDKLNFKDAQCVELDGRFRGALKSSNTPENIRCNKKRLLNYLPKRDNLLPDQLCTFSQRSVFQLYDDPTYRKDEHCWNLEKTALRRNVLRSPQKLEYDSDTLEDLHNDLRNILKMRVKVKKRIPVIDEARETGKILINLEPCKHSFATSRKNNIETEVPRSAVGAGDNAVNKTKRRMPFRSSFRNLEKQEQVSYPYSNWSTFTRERKNIDSGWRKMQVGTTTKFSTVSESLYSSDQQRPEKTYKLNRAECSIFTENSGKSKLSQPLGVNSKHGMKKDVVTRLSKFRSSPSFPSANGNSNFKNQNDGFRSDEYLRPEESVTEAGNRFRNQKFSEKSMPKPEDLTFSYETSSSYGYMDLENNHRTEESVLNEHGSELEDKNLSEEILKKSVPDVLHTTAGQDSIIRSPEEGIMFSSCFEFEPELTSSWRNTHQPSPNSVLNPLYEDEILSDIECFEGAGPADANLIGLWKKLQVLKSDVEDKLSDPGMMVSSDEGTRDVSDEYLQESGNSGVFRAKETRDFSYLVDVMDEAGFYNTNWEIDIDKLHSPDSAVNPLVFEVLEKKYGYQISWETCERRLLFDRINSGLMEILHPCLDIPEWAYSLSTWLGTQPKRNVIEEKLWNSLVSQEKEVNKGLSEKAVGGDISWLKLGGDIDIIVRDIVNSLFDELVAELGMYRVAAESVIL